MSRVRIPSLTPLESAGQKVGLRSWPELSDPPMSGFGSGHGERDLTLGAGIGSEPRGLLWLAVNNPSVRPGRVDVSRIAARADGTLVPWTSNTLPTLRTCAGRGIWSTGSMRARS